jgi:hypothetical protein
MNLMQNIHNQVGPIINQNNIDHSYNCVKAIIAYVPPRQKTIFAKWDM